MSKLNRRQMMLGSAGAALCGSSAVTMLSAQPVTEMSLTSRVTSYRFGDVLTGGLVSLEDNAPPPVLRVRQGDPVELTYMFSPGV